MLTSILTNGGAASRVIAHDFAKSKIFRSGSTPGECNARSARHVGRWLVGPGKPNQMEHAMHLMRLLQSGVSALCESELRVRLEEYLDALLDIKPGQQPWPEVNAWRLRLHKKFDVAFASTQLPERTDFPRLLSF